MSKKAKSARFKDKLMDHLPEIIVGTSLVTLVGIAMFTNSKPAVGSNGSGILLSAPKEVLKMLRDEGGAVLYETDYGSYMLSHVPNG
jgi:hypothetical protein